MRFRSREPIDEAVGSTTMMTNLPRAALAGAFAMELPSRDRSLPVSAQPRLRVLKASLPAAA
jgi:hypothetical protein